MFYDNWDDYNNYDDFNNNDHQCSGPEFNIYGSGSSDLNTGSFGWEGAHSDPEQRLIVQKLDPEDPIFTDPDPKHRWRLWRVGDGEKSVHNDEHSWPRVSLSVQQVIRIVPHHSVCT